MKSKKNVKSKKVRIPVRNQSPFRWWIASYVMRAVWDDNPDPPPRSRCTAWENTIVLQASDREAAYQKALQIAQRDVELPFSEWDRPNNTGHWVMEGLTRLLPINDRIKDGTEVLWESHENRTVAKIRSLAKPKFQLEVFDDSPIDDDE